MKICMRTVAVALGSVLLSGCVSSLKSEDLDKYKGASPGKLLSEQWYITSLNSQLFSFEAALFVEEQVRKMKDDLSGLCKVSGGTIIYHTLSKNVIQETRTLIQNSNSSAKYRKTNHGSTVYDAASAERYFGQTVRSFDSNRFIDEAMKNYIQKSYFASLDCSKDNGSSWHADIVPGDVFMDSSKVVSLPIFILTRG